MNRFLEEGSHFHAGDDRRVLEGEKHPGTSTLKHVHLLEVGAHVVDAALRDFVGGVAHDDAGKGGFSGAVSAHDDVDFTAVNHEVHAVEDRGAFNAHMEVFNAQNLFAHGHP